MTEAAENDVDSGRTTGNVSVDRLEQSVEEVLEREREASKRIAINRYVREASVRMCLNLPIKPRDTKPSDAKTIPRKPEENTLKLPNLVASSRQSMARTAESAERHTSMSVEAQVKPAPSGVTELPLIVQPEKGSKRKRKTTDTSHVQKNKGEVSKHVHRKTPLKSNLRHIHDENQASVEDDFLQVVMCGRSPLSKLESESSEKRPLYVSKHGRFKSK